jgi:hypothetical protein
MTDKAKYLASNNDADVAVRNFLARLPESERAGVCKMLKLVQSEAFAAGIAHAEQEARLRSMATTQIEDWLKRETVLGAYL